MANTVRNVEEQASAVISHQRTAAEQQLVENMVRVKASLLQQTEAMKDEARAAEQHVAEQANRHLLMRLTPH